MAFEQLPAVEYTEIRYTKADWVARITIDRPESYNCYSTRTLIELAAAFREASFDDEVAAIVFTGSGKSAFCTGGDVKEYERVYTKSPHDYWKYMGLFSAYIESILDCGKPVIGRLNGMAVGGGNESHLACDLSVIAEHAYVGQVGTKVGSVAAGGATQWLPIFVGDRGLVPRQVFPEVHLLLGVSSALGELLDQVFEDGVDCLVELGQIDRVPVQFLLGLGDQLGRGVDDELPVLNHRGDDLIDQTPVQRLVGAITTPRRKK